MDQGEESGAASGPRLVIPREFLGFPWFAWVAAALYLFILFNLFAPYF